MCGRKPKYTPAAPAAASVSAPQDTVESNVVSENQQRRKRAKGKKGLTIKATGSGSGTGVNI